MSRTRVKYNIQEFYKRNSFELDFCKTWNISYQDMEYICQGDFDAWYIDFLKYFYQYINKRIETGKASKLDLNDVWGGSHWTEQYV